MEHTHNKLKLYWETPDFFEKSFKGQEGIPVFLINGSAYPIEDMIKLDTVLTNLMKVSYQHKEIIPHIFDLYDHFGGDKSYFGRELLEWMKQDPLKLFLSPENAIYIFGKSFLNEDYDKHISVENALIIQKTYLDFIKKNKKSDGSYEIDQYSDIYPYKENPYLLDRSEIEKTFFMLVSKFHIDFFKNKKFVSEVEEYMFNYLKQEPQKFIAGLKSIQAKNLVDLNLDEGDYINPNITNYLVMHYDLSQLVWEDTNKEKINLVDYCLNHSTKGKATLNPVFSQLSTVARKTFFEKQNILDVFSHVDLESRKIRNVSLYAFHLLNVCSVYYPEQLDKVKNHKNFKEVVGWLLADNEPNTFLSLTTKMMDNKAYDYVQYMTKTVLDGKKVVSFNLNAEQKRKIENLGIQALTNKKVSDYTGPHSKKNNIL